MYGRGPSSNYKDDDHYIYDTENLKTARRNLERLEEIKKEPMIQL